MLGIIAELCVRDERALAGSDLLIQANRWGQPVQPRGPTHALITPDECLRQKSKQRVEGGKHKVDADIDDGDGQQPAGDHGAQRSQRKVEQTGQLRHSKPLQRAPHVDGAASGLHRQGNQRRRQVDYGEHQHAHGEVNGELAPPGDGQGVQQTHAAAVHQIGVQGHGQQHGEAGGYNGRRRGTAPQMAVDAGQRCRRIRGIIDPSAVAPQGQRQGAQPHGSIAEQQRPEAAEVGAGQRPIRGRYHEPHSQHLPARK